MQDKLEQLDIHEKGVQVKSIKLYFVNKSGLDCEELQERIAKKLNC